MARKSAHNLPPGIQLDKNGAFWATLEGEDAKLWRKRYPGRSLPRRKAKDLREALKLQRLLIDELKAGCDPNADNPRVADWVQTCIDRKRGSRSTEPRIIRQLAPAGHSPAPGSVRLPMPSRIELTSAAAPTTRGTAAAIRRPASVAGGGSSSSST